MKWQQSEGQFPGTIEGKSNSLSAHCTREARRLAAFQKEEREAANISKESGNVWKEQNLGIQEMKAKFRGKFTEVEEERALHFIYDELKKEQPVMVGAESFWKKFVRMVASEKSPNGWRFHFKDVMGTKLWCYDLPKAQILCIYRMATKSKIETAYGVKLFVDEYGFLSSWKFDNPDDIAKDNEKSSEAPKIQLFYLSRDDKEQNNRLWKAIKKRRIKRWIVYDYKHQLHPDDLANETMNGDIVYGDLDSLVEDAPLN
ncbi:unnamed protein product [Caenorhabditis brenneri]